MFNFIASALMVYLLVNVLIAPGSMTPETREFAAAGRLPWPLERQSWQAFCCTRSFSSIGTA